MGSGLSAEAKAEARAVKAALAEAKKKALIQDYVNKLLFAETITISDPRQWHKTRLFRMQQEEYMADIYREARRAGLSSVLIMNMATDQLSAATDSAYRRRRPPPRRRRPVSPPVPVPVQVPVPPYDPGDSHDLPPPSYAEAIKS